MKVFVSAAEASADMHLAGLLDSLKTLTKHQISAYGLGGDKLKASGADLWLHNREFSVMGGITEVIAKLPLRRRFEKRVEEALLAERPDLAILTDAGEINLRLASLFHFFKVPVIYYIPPKVWVWRSSRIEMLKDHAAKVLSILPFEKPIYDAWEIPFEYVGNPVVEELSAATKLTQLEAKRALDLAPEVDVVALLPGSRHSEIRAHTELFGRAIELFRRKAGKPISIVVPVATTLDFDQVVNECRKFIPDAKFFHGRSYECMKAARVGLVKSGTSTLEAALLGLPMVLSYRGSASSEWIYRNIVRYRGFVGLVNLFLAPNAEQALGFDEKKGKDRPPSVVPECILSAAKPEQIANELAKIFVDGEPRNKMLQEFSRLPGLLSSISGEPTSMVAARAVLGVLK